MALTTIPLFGMVPGGPELVVILLIAVLLFGANKIPKLARSTGQAIGEFQRGREEIEDELEEMREGGSSGESSPSTSSTQSQSETTASESGSDDGARERNKE